MIDKAHITKALEGFLADFPNHKMTRWDCINFLIGYYGSISETHIRVITEMRKAGLILP